ncbi:hypothetical protein BDV93DRAFT_560829 [Ceratobasidium sp. AG-I]|nr:hypothetical protein BDV93DRAFT_560829 [Ceratobasidium sp. AG-I]
MTIQISRRVLTESQFIANRDEALAKQPPSVPDSLKKKFRWLQGIVRNPTEFEVVVGASYFGSGRYQDPPLSLEAFQLGTFTVCNIDESYPTGVTSGLTYKIKLDEHKYFSFSIGFTNPRKGPCQTGVVASNNPEDGYKAVRDEGGSIETEVYEAKDVDGNAVKFKFRITAVTGNEQRPLFQVNELRYYN